MLGFAHTHRTFPKVEDTYLLKTFQTDYQIMLKVIFEVAPCGAGFTSTISLNSSIQLNMALNL